MAEDVLTEAAKLPLDERATHANWKVRSAAFEEIKQGVERVFSEDDPVLSEYGECAASPRWRNRRS